MFDATFGTNDVILSVVAGYVVVRFEWICRQLRLIKKVFRLSHPKEYNQVFKHKDDD